MGVGWLRIKHWLLLLGNRAVTKLETLVYERGLPKLEFRKTLKPKYISQDFKDYEYKYFREERI
jgi:hypothetical protein